MLLNEDSVNFAHNVLLSLNENPRSFLYNHICFNEAERSIGSAYYKSFLLKGSRSLAFSLYGGTAVAKLFNKNENWLANVFIDTYNVLDGDVRTRAILHDKQRLSRKPFGTQDSNRLLIAIVNMVAMTLFLQQKNKITPAIQEDLISSVVLMFAIKEEISIQNRLKLFATNFFKGLKSAEKEGVSLNFGFANNLPVVVTKIFGHHSFDVPRVASTNYKSKSNKELNLQVVEALPWD